MRTLTKLSFQTLFLVGVTIQFSLLLVIKAAPFSTAVFFLLLLSILLMTLRVRFKMPPQTIVVEIVCFTIIALFINEVPWFLFPSLFYLSAYGKPHYFLATIPIFLFRLEGDMTLYILHSQALLVGITLYLYQFRTHSLIDTNDKLRQQLYDMDTLQNRLLKDYHETERIAAVSERQRLSEILHDNLGHELTGAHLAIKAHNHIENKHSEDAIEMLKRAESRIEGALEKLKETVHNTEPLLESGHKSFHQLCEQFTEYPINFIERGPLNTIKPHMWQLLESTLKEGLTNILKHAEPTCIEISLEISQTIVRFTIENDGIKQTLHQPGQGLKYMRKRYEALQGSLSIQQGTTFKLIAILPFR